MPLNNAFVTSHLDMGNSLLFGLPNSQIKRLSRLQNIAARIVTRTKPREHITPILKDLHWLPVHDRIIFKILVYVFRSLNDLSPAYIRNILQPYTPIRQLRSVGKHLLTVPRTSKSWGDRSFAHAAPLLWNQLPDFIKSASSLPQFKSMLKTFIMKSDSSYFAL